MPRVEIIGVLGFVLVHVRSNDQLSRLGLRGSVIRIDWPLFWRQKPTAQQPGIIRIFVHVETEPGVEIHKFLSRKSLDLAIRGDSFAFEPNEKVTAPMMR